MSGKTPERFAEDIQFRVCFEGHEFHHAGKISIQMIPDIETQYQLRVVADTNLQPVKGFTLPQFGPPSRPVPWTRVSSSVRESPTN
jgi:hypothetical protein